MTEQQAPSDARYGVWDADAQRWTGDWATSDDEAAEMDLGCARSGLPVRVCGVRGTDDQWLAKIQD